MKLTAIHYRDLIAAASVRSVGTDTLSGINRIEDDIKRRWDQYIAGLITGEEAINYVKTG